jgi:hypothetical protein
MGVLQDYGQELALVLELAESDLAKRIYEWHETESWEWGQVSSAGIEFLRCHFVEIVLVRTQRTVLLLPETYHG